MNSATAAQPYMQTNEPLSRHTSYKIGGPAELFFRPANHDELLGTVDWCRRMNMPVRLIGGGTNILAGDTGVAGAVITTTALRGVRIAGDKIFAECGVRLPRLVKLAADFGLSGLEPLAGIPGTLGGALRMNAGTPAACMADVAFAMMIYRPDAKSEMIAAEEADFGYRCSNLGENVVQAAVLKLKAGDRERIRRATAEARAEKLNAQPMQEFSAGCVFKNPPGESAGKLIDELGLKGTAVGGAKISEKHANFIVNYGNASAADVLALVERVRKKVRQARGIDLELEIQKW